MSRILLLVLFLIWMAGPPMPQSPGESWPNLLLFFSFYAMLVLLLGLWSRSLARRVASDNFHRSLRPIQPGDVCGPVHGAGLVYHRRLGIGMGRPGGVAGR